MAEQRNVTAPSAKFGVAANTTAQATNAKLAKEQTAEAAAEVEAVSQRRSQSVDQQVALQGRQQEADRAARAKKAAEAKANAEASEKRWVMPVVGADFTSGFKMRWGRMHEGNDLACPTGTPIKAMSSGVVIFTGWYGGGGNTTKIRYWDGTVSYYEHQSKITATVGQQVSPGDIVGYVGNTGHSFGSHLHLEIHPGGDSSPAIDPHPWMAEHGLKY